MRLTDAIKEVTSELDKKKLEEKEQLEEAKKKAAESEDDSDDEEKDDASDSDDKDSDDSDDDSDDDKKVDEAVGVKNNKHKDSAEKIAGSIETKEDSEEDDVLAGKKGYPTGTKESEEFEFKAIDESVFKAELGGDLNGLFEDVEGLPEGFADKAKTIIEAAVTRRVKAEVANLNSFANDYFNEQLKEAVETLEEKADKYLSYVAEEWVKENELAIEKGLKVEAAEKFLDALHDLFVEHNVEVPEEKVDLYAEQAEQLESTKTELSESYEKIMEMKGLLRDASKEICIREFTETMSVAQRDKIRSLAEDIDFKNSDEFKTKLETLSEHYSEKKARKKNDQENLVEGFESSDEHKTQGDPIMESINKTISRLYAK